MPISQSFARTNVLMGTLIVFAMLHLVAFAGGKSYINTERDGIALKGYDAVAYFTLGKPTQGTKEFAFKWMEATWYFANKEHLELFQSDPEKYAPQYGGYCAWAVSHNYTWPADPLAWKIVNDKLYLNADKNVQAMWVKEIPELIIKGDKNWPSVLNR
jgi:YHS domain-containing protein